MSEKKALDPAIVRELAKILREDGLTEIELELGDLKLRLARMAAVAPVQAFAPAPAPVLQAGPAPAPAVAAPAEDRNHPGALTSPMVGTIYLAPAEDAPEFVKEGDAVVEGQTLMVVEAMKTFNPIPAPRAGKVKKILVANKQPVEFGEALAIIE
ncbi:MAG: acetyl-CoA carboxylase biotin carboxyl carrier protein [Hyphomonadaceae bacterium]|nr:acetyl-CoA carboxylase biotin carboxyl carrier protein [Hyphomonadaceae bacterium]